MANLVWSRNMTRERLHESEDIKKELVHFYDYDRLLEAFDDVDDDTLKDVVDSDERFDAIDNQYYDEEVRPKIEAQTLDGIVLLVERPEEDGQGDKGKNFDKAVDELNKTGKSYNISVDWDEDRVEDPDPDKKEESLKKGKKLKESADNRSKYSKYFVIKEAEGEEADKKEEPKKEDELPPLEGMAILADEIPEEFPDAKIVDDGDGFVLEDGDKKYDMYAIPEDKAEEFMETCMDDPMEDVMEEDEEFESGLDIDVDSINDNCDFSKVPEVCERITGEPTEEEEEPAEEPEEEEKPAEEPKEKEDVEESLREWQETNWQDANRDISEENMRFPNRRKNDYESIDEAISVDSSEIGDLESEVSEVQDILDTKGAEELTSMPFSEYEGDPSTFEHNYPILGRLFREYWRETVGIDSSDDDVCDDTWDVDTDSDDWNTVMSQADWIIKRGGGKVQQFSKVYKTARTNSKYGDFSPTYTPGADKPEDARESLERMYKENLRKINEAYAKIQAIKKQLGESCKDCYEEDCDESIVEEDEGDNLAATQGPRISDPSGPKFI